MVIIRKIHGRIVELGAVSASVETVDDFMLTISEEGSISATCLEIDEISATIEEVDAITAAIENC